MARITFANTLRTADAALTGLGTIAADLPVTNLQVDQPSEPCRWTSLSGMGVQVQLAASAAIGLVYLGAHNGSAAGTWRIRAATSSANLTAAPGFDSGSLSLWPASGKPDPAAARLSSLAIVAPGAAYTWWRIDITDAANADGFFEAGNLVLDVPFTPERAQDWGTIYGRADETPQLRAKSGTLWPGEIPGGAVQRVRLSRLSEDEAFGTFWEVERRIGLRKPLLVVPDSDDTAHLHRKMIFGLLTRLSGVRRLNNVQYGVTVEIEELVP
jgi:hypothetical protein